jgi:hypothetical protein
MVSAHGNTDDQRCEALRASVERVLCARQSLPYEGIFARDRPSCRTVAADWRLIEAGALSDIPGIGDAIAGS